MVLWASASTSSTFTSTSVRCSAIDGSWVTSSCFLLQAVATLDAKSAPNVVFSVSVHAKSAFCARVNRCDRNGSRSMSARVKSWKSMCTRRVTRALPLSGAGPFGV